MKKKGNEKIGKEREKSIAERFAEELVEEIKEDFKERQQARRPYELSWQLNMNFLAGNQYCSVAGDSLVEDEKTFEWQEKQVFNHIAPVYETRLAKLSRVRPKMTVRPFTDEDKDVNSAKLAKKILESCSEKLSVNGIIDKGTMWSEACGTASKSKATTRYTRAETYRSAWCLLSRFIPTAACAPIWTSARALFTQRLILRRRSRRFGARTLRERS